jgi:hypothetical protein
MDNKRIVEILKGTIDSQYRQEAEEQLNQVREIPQTTTLFYNRRQ